MNPVRINATPEVHPGSGPKGMFLLGDCVERLESLLPEWEGRVKLVYMDPPYLTGEKFYMRLRVGEAGWGGSRNTMAVESFVDHRDRQKYLDLLRRVLALCRRLLSDDGMLFLHIDYRSHPHVRLLMDEIFGEENFLNELIWVYQTGGRSTRHFSRKHDVILFYRKSESYDFNIDAVKAPPAAPRKNHMRRHVDPDGRVYRSIKVGDRVYTYYDDDPVAPSDVWDDLSHLQQKDPERTGYDTQKPLALLNRIVRCASRSGEWVLDPFAGSSTTLEAALRLGRNFIGIDAQPMTLNIARRRLRGANLAISGADNGGDALVACDVEVTTGVGFYHVRLNRFEVEVPGLQGVAKPMDCVDNWSVGYVRDGVYEVMAEFARTRRQPALAEELLAPVYSGQLAMCVSDLLGRSWYFALEPGM